MIPIFDNIPHQPIQLTTGGTIKYLAFFRPIRCNQPQYRNRFSSHITGNLHFFQITPISQREYLAAVILYLVFIFIGCKLHILIYFKFGHLLLASWRTPEIPRWQSAKWNISYLNPISKVRAILLDSNIAVLCGS